MRKSHVWTAAGSGALLVAATVAWVAADRPAAPGTSAASTGPGAVASGAPGAAQQDTLARDERATLAAKDSLTPAEQAILDHYRAERGPQQPIPFNHEWHVSTLQMECEYCHTGSRRSEVAIMPSLELCIGCHRVVGGNLTAVAQLRAYWDRGEPVEWDRVYRLPEFVQFSHQPHLRNQIECEECHGPVEEMARVYQYSDLSMGWCLSCHREAPAETDVATTYLLTREFPPPPIPRARQERGLYPIQIDQEYGATRAPGDCTVCHY